jgi:hypothetical protein
LTHFCQKKYSPGQEHEESFGLSIKVRLLGWAVILMFGMSILLAALNLGYFDIVPEWLNTLIREGDTNAIKALGPKGLNRLSAVYQQAMGTTGWRGN